MRAREQAFPRLAGEAPDIGDQAVATQLTEFDNVMAHRHVEALRDIDSALLRIELCRFGRCVGCGAAISAERLAASPTAQRCLKCQGVHERTCAHEATPTL